MRKLWEWLIVFFKAFFQELIPMRAASLAFTTLLSVVPLFIFIFYIFSYFPMLSTASRELEQYIVMNFVANSAEMILQQMHAFVSRIQHLSWLDVASLASIAVLLIYNIVDTVNSIWHVKMNGLSIIALIMYWIALSILPVIFAFLLLVSSYLKTLALFSAIEKTSFWQSVVFREFPWVLEWMTFSLFQYLMPSCRVRWRYAVIAGFITTVAFEIAKWGFVQYIHYFPTYQLFYGALAGIPIFFLWVFLVWLIIIGGALICRLLHLPFSKP